MSDRLRVNVISMSRTGHRAIMSWLRDVLGVSIYNKESKPFGESLKAGGLPVLVLRDYHNWLASMVKHMLPLTPYHPKVEEVRERHIDMWIGHMQAAFTVPTILYPEWCKAGYGKHVNFRGNPTNFSDGDTLHRYEQMCEAEPKFREALERRTDALAINRKVFGGPTAEGRVGALWDSLTVPAAEIFQA